MIKTTSRTIDPQEALSILKDFYIEVKKELKKRGQTQFIIEEENNLCGSLHFICDGFNLSFTIKEGGMI